MKNALGFIFVLLLLSAMGLLCVRKLARYNPDGDKCEHGVRGGEGFSCQNCSPYPEE